jgi:hypothetical protein
MADKTKLGNPSQTTDHWGKLPDTDTDDVGFDKDADVGFDQGRAPSDFPAGATDWGEVRREVPAPSV